mgnify:FL=1
MVKSLQDKMNDGREYRNMKLEAREAGDGEMIVEGYATTFNQPYMLWKARDYEVWEQVDARAFDDCDMNDVIFQYDHEGRVFARNKNGTMSLAADAVGLFTRADLSGTDIGRQLYQEIKGGYTDKMSFCFTVDEDERTIREDNEKTVVMRTIKRIGKLYDVSAVSIPANDATSISARSYGDGVIAELQAERLVRANKIKKIKLMMEV